MLLYQLCSQLIDPISTTCAYGDGMASRLATAFGIQCYVSLNLDAEVDEKIVYAVEKSLSRILSVKFQSIVNGTGTSSKSNDNL